MPKRIIMNSITPDGLVRLLGYTVNTVTEELDDNGTTVEFTKEIDGAIIGVQVNFTDDSINLSQEYLIDVLPENEMDGD